MTEVCCSIAFEVLGPSVPKGNLRSSRSGHSYYPNGAKVRTWAGRVADRAAEAMGRGPIWTGAVRLDLTFVLPRPKGHYGSGRNAATVKASAPAWPITMPDRDKLERTVADALTGVVYRDDAQVVAGDTRKQYPDADYPAAGVYVTASEYKEPSRV